MELSPTETNLLPPLRERPDGFIAPASITGQHLISSKHIPCNCRCGYYALPDKVNHKCLHPDHQGSRILFSAMCYQGKEEGDFNGICNFCLSLQEASTSKVLRVLSDDVIRKCANGKCGKNVSNPSIDGVGTELCDECDGALQKSLLGDDSDASSDDEDDEDDIECRNYVYF